MLLNLPQAEDMLFLPLVRKSQELSWLDFALELIDIHRVNTALEPLAFCIESLDCSFVVPAMLCLRGLPCCAHPIQDFVVKRDISERPCEIGI